MPSSAISTVIAKSFTVVVLLTSSAIVMQLSEAGAQVPGPSNLLVQARQAEQSGSLAQAERLYQSVLAADITSQEAHHRLGVLAAQRGDLNRAITHFTTAEGLGAISVQLLNDFGGTLFLKGDLASAEEKLRKALAVDPNNKRASDNLALLQATRRKRAHVQSAALVRQLAEQKAAEDTRAAAKAIADAQVAARVRKIAEARAESESKAAEQEIAQLQEEKVQITSRLRQLKEERNAEEARVAAESRAAEEEIARLQQSNAQIAAKLRELTEERAETEARVAAELRAASESRVAAEARVAAELRAAAEAIATAEARAAEKLRAETEVRAAEQQITRLQQSNSKIAARLLELNQERAKSEAEAAAAAKALAKTQAATEARIAAQEKARFEASQRTEIYTRGDFVTPNDESQESLPVAGQSQQAKVPVERKGPSMNFVRPPNPASPTNLKASPDKTPPAVLPDDRYSQQTVEQAPATQSEAARDSYLPGPATKDRYAASSSDESPLKKLTTSLREITPSLPAKQEPSDRPEEEVASIKLEAEQGDVLPKVPPKERYSDVSDGPAPLSRLAKSFRNFAPSLPVKDKKASQEKSSAKAAEPTRMMSSILKIPGAVFKRVNKKDGEKIAANKSDKVLKSAESSQTAQQPTVVMANSVEPAVSQPLPSVENSVSLVEHSAVKKTADVQSPYEEILRQEPDTSEGHWKKAQSLLALGQSDGAMESIDVALRNEPQTIRYLLTKARCLFDQAEFAEAEKIARSIETSPISSVIEKAHALTFLGQLTLESGTQDASTAIAMHMQAIRLAQAIPDEASDATLQAAKDVQIAANLGVAHSIGRGRWNKKPTVVPVWVGRAEQLAQAKIDHEDGPLYLRLQVIEGALQAFSSFEPAMAPKGLLQEAEIVASEILSLSNSPSDQAQAEWLMGLINVHATKLSCIRKEYEQAIQYGQRAQAYLEKSVADRSSSRRARYELGKAYYWIGVAAALAGGDQEKVLDWYMRSSALLVSSDQQESFFPVDAGTDLVKMGKAFWEAKLTQKALDTTSGGAHLLQQVADRGSSDRRALFEAYQGLAEMHRRLGQAEQAAAYAQQAAANRN